MSRNKVQTAASRERGAVKIKTLLGFLIVGAAAFVVIKVAPVYVQQRQVTHDIEELARVAALRNYGKEEIDKRIEEVLKKYDLKQGSISLAAKEKGSVKIAISYNIPINLLVTTYNWQYDRTVSGSEF